MTNPRQTDINGYIQRRYEHPRHTGRDRSEQVVAIDRNEWSQSSECAPYLEIRHRNLKGGIKNAENDQFLIIRYDRVVPGFFNGYAQFFSLEELETIIKAHLFLYGLMAPTIEGGIHEVLGKEGDT